MMPRCFIESSILYRLSVFPPLYPFYPDGACPLRSQCHARINCLGNQHCQKEYCNDCIAYPFERRKGAVHPAVSAEPPCGQLVRLVKVYFRVYAPCDVLDSVDGNQGSSIEFPEQSRHFLFRGSPGYQLRHLVFPYGQRGSVSCPRYP